MYIAVHEDVPDFIVPTLVGHAVLGFHLNNDEPLYQEWITSSFRKCTIKVNAKEWKKIIELDNVGLFHENTTLDGMKSCAVKIVGNEIPNVLKFAKLWKPI